MTTTARNTELLAMPGDRVQILHGATWEPGNVVSVRTEWFEDGAWNIYAVYVAGSHGQHGRLIYTSQVRRISRRVEPPVPASALNMELINNLLEEIAGDTEMMPKTAQLIAQLTTALDVSNAETIRLA